MKRTLTVILNGTEHNPFHILGLTQNPFPAIPKHEMVGGMLAINSLNGDPLKGPDDIRERLKGKVSNELIELCVRMFVPGKSVQFEVQFDDGEQ